MEGSNMYWTEIMFNMLIGEAGLNPVMPWAVFHTQDVDTKTSYGALLSFSSIKLWDSPSKSNKNKKMSNLMVFGRIVEFCRWSFEWFTRLNLLEFG
jgi:hypothetical protein